MRSVKVTWNRRITGQALPEFLTGKIVKYNKMVAVWDILFCKNRYREQLSFRGFFYLLLTPQKLPPLHSLLLWGNILKEVEKSFIMAKLISILCVSQEHDVCAHWVGAGVT